MSEEAANCGTAHADSTQQPTRRPSLRSAVIDACRQLGLPMVEVARELNAVMRDSRQRSEDEVEQLNDCVSVLLSRHSSEMSRADTPAGTATARAAAARALAPARAPTSAPAALSSAAAPCRAMSSAPSDDSQVTRERHKRWIVRCAVLLVVALFLWFGGPWLWSHVLLLLLLIVAPIAIAGLGYLVVQIKQNAPTQRWLHRGRRQ